MGLILNYIVKSNADLKDLQKVFICAVEKDIDLYLDRLSDDLFKAQPNISVWYPAKDEGIPDDEEAYISLLSDMDLFVIPVTRSFLNEESRARNIEMTYAMENGIPVLPVLFEKISKSRFSEVCGKLHVLDRNDPDPTSLPFEEKLKLFMDTVLLKDEMISKIRQAFAAYIFLSYRKKDRKYAQDVMRLIHSNPFARDIAIWYDEYLTPGEDFNESIRHAFEKSDLFALVVTPNLLEPANYVMRVEYPMAFDNGKKIIPFMPVKTDGEDLKRCYPGIPDMVDSNKENADYIDKLIREALTIRHDDSPEHKYIMGLAYLSGIDVETDHERALSLITDAAGQDLDEAILKLVTMYENGQGVRRSYYYGALWHEKYVSLLAKRLADGKADENSRERLLKEININVLKWHNIFRDDKAWHMCVEMYKYSRGNMTVDENMILLENSIIASQISLSDKKANLYYVIEPHTRAADEYIDKVCADLLADGEGTKAKEVRKFYSAQIDLLRAQSKREAEDWQEAINRYEDLVIRFEDCCALSNMEYVKRSKHNLVICYGELADSMYHLNGLSCEKSAVIQENAQRSIELAARYEEEGVVFTEKETMIPKFILVNGLIEKREFGQAEKILSDFISLCEKRKEEEESVDSMRLLSQAHILFAKTERMKDNTAEEEKHLIADTELLHRLSGVIGNNNVYLQEIEDYKRLVEIAVKQGTDHKEYLNRLFGIGIWHYRNDKDYFRQLAAIARNCDDYPMFQKITMQMIEIDKNNRS